MPPEERLHPPVLVEHLLAERPQGLRERLGLGLLVHLVGEDEGGDDRRHLGRGAAAEDVVEDELHNGDLVPCAPRPTEASGAKQAV